MVRLFKLFFAFTALVTIIGTASYEEKPIGTATSIAIFRIESQNFSTSTVNLKNAISVINSDDPETIVNARKALKHSRLCYKRIESFLEYFFIHSARIYNRAAKNEIEEPYLEYQAPMGLQFIESLLFEDNPASRKKELTEQINILTASASDLNSLLYEFRASDNQILESQRIELIRVIALGIAGFDAPFLKSGIEESHAALQVMKKAILPYFNRRNAISDSILLYLDHSILYLEQNPDFDSFDRLYFLTEKALPLQKHFGKWISKMGLGLNTAGILNYQAENMFSTNAFNNAVFDPKKITINEKEIVLGRKLFSDPVLSGNSKISCATCHSPETFFQDGLDKSFGFDANKKLKRNAPTLFYASYQHSQFWDGRVKTLEEQIENVIKDTLEMNSDPEIIVKNIREDHTYRKMFRKAFSKNKRDEITEENVYRAVASFVRTLHPYNSPFDRYMQGNRLALSTSQVNGFNLFMGKGQCGTCHFAPLFNGLIPPLYTLTEFEVLGTTLTDNLVSPQPDPDDGRINFRPIEFYKGAFKTPTVRNSTVSGPYMHNGAFKSLESVIEFYNKGGGAGLGLDLPYQTLSSKSLNLTEQEKTDIINFLRALTDDTLKGKSG